MSLRHREHELEEHEHSHDHSGDHETSGNTTEVKMVARTFRYMRRKPTIIAYKPPQGNKLFSYKFVELYYMLQFCIILLFFV